MTCCTASVVKAGTAAAGQVAGIGWAQAEAAAALAGDGSSGLQGLRDAAIILVLSDTLARISEVAALQCRDLEAYTTNAGGSAHIRASKADQFGEGSTRYIGPATLAAINRYLQVGGHATGPLFRRVLRGGHGSSAPLAAASIRTIVRKRVAAVPGSGGRVGGHSFRVGSARELAAAGASVAELQQAGGWRSPAPPPAVRSPGTGTGCAASLALWRREKVPGSGRQGAASSCVGLRRDDGMDRSAQAVQRATAPRPAGRGVTSLPGGRRWPESIRTHSTGTVMSC